MAPFHWKGGVIEGEMERELEWARARPTSRHMIALGGGNPMDEQELENPFEMALNEMEFEFLKKYQKMWPGSAYALNQDPSSGHGHHAPDAFQMFTLIANFGLVWADDAARWLMPTEALACQRFPVIPGLRDPSLQLTSFHLANPQRSGRRIFHQVGNSMHCGVMALLQLHSFSEVKHRAVPSLFRNIRLARQAMGEGIDCRCFCLSFIG